MKWAGTNTAVLTEHPTNLQTFTWDSQYMNVLGTYDRFHITCVGTESMEYSLFLVYSPHTYPIVPIAKVITTKYSSS